MLIATVSLEGDGRAIMLATSEATEKAKTAWECAKRFIIEVLLISPADLVESKVPYRDSQSLAYRGRELYRQWSDRMPEKVCVYGDFKFTAQLERSYGYLVDEVE